MRLLSVVLALLGLGVALAGIDESLILEDAPREQPERPFKGFRNHTTAPSLAPLVDWLDSYNVTVMGVKAVEYPEDDERGFGLVATMDIPAGLIYIIQPLSTLLLGQEIRRSPLADVIPAGSREMDALVLLIAHARRNASDRWHVPASLLPPLYGQPGFWEEATVAELQNSGLRPVAEQMRETSKVVYKQLPDALKERVAEEDFLFASGAAMSFAQKLFFVNSKEEQIPRLAMVPLLTMLEYAGDDSANTHCAVVSTLPYLACNATRDIKEGEAITTFIDYESTGANAHLLMHRGVMLRGARNHADRVPIPLPSIDIKDDDPTLPVKQAVWNNTAKVTLLSWVPPATNETALGLPGQLDILLAYTRLMLLQEEDIRSLSPKQVYDVIRSNVPFSAQHETDVIDLLTEYLQSVLDKYPTSRDHDQKLLAELTPKCEAGDKACFRRFFHLRAAISVRLEEKEILHSIIDRLDAYREAFVALNPSQEDLRMQRRVMLAKLPPAHPQFNFGTEAQQTDAAPQRVTPAKQMQGAQQQKPAQQQQQQQQKPKIDIRTEL